MSTLKAILIDDEKGSLESLSFEIKEYCPEVEIISACQDPQDGIKKIRQLHPDLVFLDIEMPGMNGFAALRVLRRYGGTVEGVANLLCGEPIAPMLAQPGDVGLAATLLGPRLLAVWGGSAWHSAGEQGLVVMQILDAIYESARTGAPVHIG